MADFETIKKQIESKQFASVYLLAGEEPFYIDLLINQFEESVPEEEKDFNLLVFYGKETEWQAVVSAARGFPMFGDRLIVILKEATQMKDLNELVTYIDNPMASTTLIIEHRFKKIDNRGKLKKAFDKKGVYYNSEKIKEDAVKEWILNYCADNQINIEKENAEMIANHLGNDLQKIVNEIQKILINQGPNKQITAELIQEYIGISKEYNLFDLPDALFAQNSEKLSRMLNHFSASPNSAPMPVVLSGFYNFFKSVYLSYHTRENFQQDRKMNIWSKHRSLARQLPEQKIHRLFAVLEEFSHKSVGINSNKDNVLLKEMIGKMKFLISAN